MPETFSPQELARMRAGQEDALAAAIARMMPAIRRGAARCACPGLEYEDAVQEGIIAVFHAAHTYEESHGARFETYAVTCILNAQLSARRHATSQKHAPLNESVPLEDEQLLSPRLSPEELMIESEQYTAFLRRMDGQLSTLEKTVLALRLRGLSYAAIARQLGRTPKTVENALARARAKLKSP